MFDVTRLTATLTTITSAVTDTADTVTNAVSERLGDIAKLDLTNLDVSKIELPTFDLPKVDLPKFEMPADLPVEVERVADVVRDATYAGIGALVIAAQMVDGRLRTLLGDAA